MPLTVNPTFGSAVGLGGMPDDFIQPNAIDGTLVPWVKAPVGTKYIYKPSDTANPKLYIKRQNNGRTDDWSALGMHCLQQRVLYSQFTDGGSTAGTLNLTETIPAGAKVSATSVDNITGFTGDTSATMLIGESGDTDRYMTGTPSVFTTAEAGVDFGAVSGTAWHSAAKTVLVTVTSAADFTAVTAGAARIRIYYVGGS